MSSRSEPVSLIDHYPNLPALYGDGLERLPRSSDATQKKHFFFFFFFFFLQKKKKKKKKKHTEDLFFFKFMTLLMNKLILSFLDV